MSNKTITKLIYDTQSVKRCEGRSLDTLAQLGTPYRKEPTLFDKNINTELELLKLSAKQRKQEKGLSIPLNLTAHLKLKIAQNGEGQAFIQEISNSKKALKGGKEEKSKRGGKRTMIQSGLTTRGKKTIRIISDCYNKLVTEKEFYYKHELDDNVYNSYCRFITLTFRNIIPTDKEAKRLLDNFLKRLRRKKGRNIHYVWVAEIQSNRLKKTGIRAIHFHILTPEKIIDNDTGKSSHQIRLEENTWINRAWNEVVANWALSTGKINSSEHCEWLGEYKLSEKYYKKLVAHRMGKGPEPRRPRKSKYMLLPNCVHVLKAGNYMTKYMSKEGQNIVGGMYDASKISREFLEKRELVCTDVENAYQGNKIIDFMTYRAKMEKVYVANWEVEFNETRGIWCKDAYKLLEWYYDYLEIQNSS